FLRHQPAIESLYRSYPQSLFALPVALGISPHDRADWLLENALLLGAVAVLFAIEWGAAEFLGGGLGIAYWKLRNDPWDAQKDMALAALGGIVAMLVTAAINWHFQRDFARSWAES
ncbi:MAG TPA: DUF2238 domain-containing protein, partial [Longimicrobiales bacterium]|nr:DUF2238 domain-containing protein [Longimicrobiales bacterium]